MELDDRVDILLVNDRPEQLLAMEAVLADPGQNVVTAQSGREALRCLLKQDFAVILLDVNMPDIDGFETAKLARLRPRSEYTPIIFVTALSTSELQVAEGYALGAVDYVSTPVQPEILRAKVAGFVELYRKSELLKRQAAELNEARALLSSVLDAPTQYSIIAVDMRGTIVVWNEGARINFGYTVEEMVARENLQRLFAAEQAPADTLRDLEVAALSDQPTPGICQCVRKDGEQFMAKVRATARRDATGAPIGYVVMVWDVTQRLRAEAERARLTAEVEHERATLAAVMTSMSDGLVVVDATQRIRYVNARAAELWDVAPEEMIGKTVEDGLSVIRSAFVDPDSVWRAREQALARLDERPHFEVSFLGPPARDVQYHMFPVADAGAGGRGYGLVLRDVTAERDLQRTKDELVSVVSHELRTPLASLVGFAELLLTRDVDEAQRRQFLTVMSEEGQRLTALINDFLDLQRMESGRQEVCAEPTDVHGLLEHAAIAAGEDPKHPFVFDVPAGLPPVRADADRMQQVLANLISNARKYSPQGSAVWLAARPTEGAIEFSVRDQGLGLPPEALPRLFEKFYRVDNSDRRSIKGTGLGLAICRQLVAAHGGRIWAESAGPGEGSRFCFTLPVVEDEELLGEVLIIEDDANFARLLAVELAERGVTSVRASSGEAALEQIVQVQPRAIVLDLLLPGLSGEAFLARLAAGGLRQTPVVVVSVKELTLTERETLERLGAVAILRKGPGAAAHARQQR